MNLFITFINLSSGMMTPYKLYYENVELPNHSCAQSLDFSFNVKFGNTIKFYIPKTRISSC